MTLPQGTYLDHNATSPLRPEAREAVLEVLGFPGNASSVHKPGRAARRLVEAARADILSALNAGGRDVLVFTSGATEANNMALRGSGCERVLVSAIEHPSVLNAAPPGAEIIPVTPDGVVDLAALDAMLAGTDRSTLVSVMQVNNETGVIQPIDEVVKIARRHSALTHVDAVQAVGRILVDIQKLGVDFLTISSHKLGGPQGAGALVLANCVTLDPPLMRGGNQEKNLRPGTENLATIHGFAAALKTAVGDMGKMAAVKELRDFLEKKIKEIEPDVRFFGTNVSRVTNTSMFSVNKITSETQLIALDLAGVYASNGAACSSGTVKPSHVLKAMGVGDDMINCALRVSLGWNTTQEDVDAFLAAWGELYARARR